MASKKEMPVYPPLEENSSCCNEETSVYQSQSDRLDRSLSINLIPVKNSFRMQSCDVQKEKNDLPIPIINQIKNENTACCVPLTSTHRLLNASEESASKPTYYVFKVEGMDCPSCAATLQKGIDRLPGIEEAKVYYPKGSMQVSTDGTIAHTLIEQTAKQLGYHAHLSVIDKGKTYHIHGMDCGSCADTITKHLSRLDGVKDVQVHFATGKMIIDHDLSEETIMEEVSRVGYQASPAAEQSSSSKQEASSRGVTNTIVSGILLLSGFISSFTPAPAIISIFLYIAVIVIGGYTPAKSAFYAIKNRSLDMNVLMMGAAIGAPLIGEYMEGALVVWLFALGNTLQQYSITKTRKSINHLMELAPANAWVKINENWMLRPVEEIQLGQKILIKPGEKIPLDGIIKAGYSMIDQSPITGESLPVDKGLNDMVYAGTLNDFGTLEVEVTAYWKDTTLSRIIHLVEEAQEQQAPTQSFVDRFAAIYTPIVFAAAISIIVFPPLIGFGGWADWVYRGLALLVVACPCALVISTPVAIVSAIGNAAKQGVLIKGGAFLEAAGSLNALAFDKTGTLTEGKPIVEKIHALNGDTEKLLSLAYTLESYSNHPIARSIVSYAKEQKIKVLEGADFFTESGKGISGTIYNEKYFAGKPEWLAEKNIPLEHIQKEIQILQEEGMTIILIGTLHRLLGYIGVADTIRPKSLETVHALRKNGILDMTILTGDNKGTAAKIAQQAAIGGYEAGLLPEDKAKVIRDLQQEGKKVGMIGDGINDAPALATANVGIAMGGAGTDTSMEAADIVLMADNLEKLPFTIQLSRQALRIIKQNIWFAVLIKAIALLLIVPDLLTLWMAVLSDTGAALLVVANSLRLFRLRE